VVGRFRRRSTGVLRGLSRRIDPLVGSIMKVRTDRPVAALTFDDGPDEHDTEGILEVLARHSASASFFVLAQRAARLPEIVDAIRLGGHEIALHGDDHSTLLGCSMRAKVGKIQTGKRRLEGLLAERVRFYRPPYGWQDLRGFFAARMVAGLDVVGWSASGSDWEDISPAQVADRISAHLRPGAIILLHERCEPLPLNHRDVPPNTPDRVQMVEEVIAKATMLGIHLVSVGTLLGQGIPVRRPWFWNPKKDEVRRLQLHSHSAILFW
jgi:peptidoglycan/xylan/chitin deacetylase (PgdA/CDA1 family)